jgi:hypothetical protein
MIKPNNGDILLFNTKSAQGISHTKLINKIAKDTTV